MQKNIFKLFKESLKNKNSYIPNLLTASRLAGAFIVPGLFLSGNIPLAFIAVSAFAATDFLDGKIARKYNGFSEFGRILDPIADKVFAIVPSLAILPITPILALNIGAEAIIAYINSKSYQNNGHPKSSFLGKFKTFCLFPTIVFCYLNIAFNIPLANIIIPTLSLGTLGIQGLTAFDYYQKAKKENNIINIDKENNDNKTTLEYQEKDYEYALEYQNDSYNLESQNNAYDLETQNDIYDLDCQPEQEKNKVKTMVKTYPKKNAHN